MPYVKRQYIVVKNTNTVHTIRVILITFKFSKPHCWQTGKLYLQTLTQPLLSYPRLLLATGKLNCLHKGAKV